MKRSLSALAGLTLAVTVAGSGNSFGCSLQTVSGTSTVIEPRARFDQRTFDAAIRAEVNFQRCRAGLKPLKGAASLARVAQTHAKWMAGAGTVSHTSTVSGQSTVKSRIISTGIRLRAGSENIGMVHRYRIDGSSFRIGKSGACDFADAAGRAIPPHTYGSLARTMVGYWMGSSGHRRNILDPKVSMVATGAGFAANAPYCGQFFVSQDFAG
jgi:uncharacterized protein YkwD